MNMAPFVFAIVIVALQAFYVDCRLVYPPGDLALGLQAQINSSGLFTSAEQGDASAPALPNAKEHRVHDLPGAPAGFDVAHFAGLLPVDDKPDGGKLFYWLFEAEENPEDKPLTIWLNGGPGCSSFDGLMVELGPFRPAGDGTLEGNPFSWHKVSNMLFVDQPVGTGLSYAGTTGYATSQSVINEQFYTFLQNFFKVHPKYLLPGRMRTRPVYFTGESYAGRYIPCISNYILQKGNPSVTGNLVEVDIQALAIGNGWTDPPTQYNYGPFVHGSGLVDDEQKRSLEELYQKCHMMLQQASPSARSVCSRILDQVILESGVAGGKYVNYYDIRDYEINSVTDWPAPSKYVPPYLNRKEVRKAIHATETPHEFSGCSGEVSSALGDEFASSSVKEVKELLELGTRILFYNGQFDIICNHMGTEKYLNSLSYSGTSGIQDSDRFVWVVDGAPAGYGRSSDDGLLSYLTVLGGSHMVPFDVPKQSLDMFTRFLGNHSYLDSAQSFSAEISPYEELDTLIPGSFSRRVYRMTMGSILFLACVAGFVLYSSRGPWNRGQRYERIV